MFNNADYDSLSTAIVNDFVQDGSETLQTRIAKVASDLRMGPNEARRLLERTNVRAHLTLFDKRAAEDDRYVEFAVADPDALMSELFGQADTRADASNLKTASQALPTNYLAMVPDERAPVENAFFQMKVAQADDGPDLTQVAVRVQDVVKTMREDLAVKRAALDDSIATLKERTQYLMTEEKLASRILNMHDLEGVNVIQRMCAVGMLDGTEKIAAEIIVEDEPYDALIALAVKRANEYSDAETAFNSVMSYLARV